MIKLSHIITICCVGFGFIVNAAKPEAILPEKNMAFLNKYCMDCHDAETEKGKINLEDLSFNIKTIPQAELWKDVLSVVNSGEMPPKKKKQPTNTEKADFLEDLSTTMVLARKVLSDSGGKITMRRLNKRDYQNSIENLIGVKLDDKILPDDGGSGDFDTVGKALFISSDKFEQYLTLARKALDEYYKQEKAKNAKPFVHRIEPEKEVNKKRHAYLKKAESVKKRFEMFNKEVDAFLAIPKNKKRFEELSKNTRIRKQDYRTTYTYLAQIKGHPDPKKHGFPSLKAASKSYESIRKNYVYHKHYAELPHSDKGAYIQLTQGQSTRFNLIPKKGMPIGRYKIRVQAAAVEGSPAFRHFLEVGHPGGPIEERGQFTDFPITSMHVKGTIAKPEIIETIIEVNSDTTPEFAIRERQPEWGALRKFYFYPQMNRNGYGHPPAIWVDWAEIEGPLPPAERTDALTKIFKSNEEIKSDTQRARNILTSFAQQAFRGSNADPAFIESLMAIFKNRLTIEKNFDTAIRTPLSIIMASPQFIYIKENGKGDETRTLTDRELAIRLSYFLWSSPPDAELLKLAEAKKMTDPEVLKSQVERMIQDPKAHSFVSGLAHQWLDMKRLDFFQFSARYHREFDENQRAAAREEVYQTILYLLRSKEEGQLQNLIKSDFVVVNAMLAAHYDMKGVDGDHYRKVKLPEKSPRGGLLGMAAINAMGSDGTESSPVERGAWVLRHMLHDPPPPAPANVPQLSRLDEKKLTKRQKLTAHQEEPQCASCHRKIDPIGFGLENFNATGKWRIKDEHARSRKPIDVSGQIYKGAAFKDFFELRDRIYDKKDNFARGFTEALIEYGLGRPFAFTDEDLVQKILTQAKSKDYSLSEFIHTLVQTNEFQSK